MKMQTFRMVTFLRNRFLAASISAAFLLAGNSVQAQSTESPKTAVVKHLGNTGDIMFFQVQVDNNSGEKVRVSVKDHEGVTVFQEFYTDKKIDKRFSIPKTDNNRITFYIKSSKDPSSQAFEINTSTKLVEEVIVKRID